MSSPGGGDEGLDDLIDPRLVQGGGLRELVVGDRGGGHGLPAAVGACEGGAGVRVELQKVILREGQ